MAQIGNFTYLGKPKQDCGIGGICEDDHIQEWWIVLIVVAVSILCYIAAVKLPRLLEGCFGSNEKISQMRYGKYRHKRLVDDYGQPKISYNDVNVLLQIPGERKCANTVLCSFFISMAAFAVMMLFFQIKHQMVAYIWALISSLSYSWGMYHIPQETTKKAILGQNVGQPPMEDFTPRNVYQDFSAPWIHVILVFLLQLGLFSIYLFSTLNGDSPCFNHFEAYLLMGYSIFLRAIYYGIDCIYRSKNSSKDVVFWDTIWYGCHENRKCFVTSYSRDKNEDDVLNRRITRMEWFVRYFMEIIINGIVYMFLAFLVIVQAANGDWQDFVFNFITARFILELDDYSTWNVDDNTFRLRVVSDMEPQEIVDKILRDDDYKSQFKALIQTVKIDGKTPYSSSQHAENVIQIIDSRDETYFKDQLVAFVNTMETPPPSDLPVNLLHRIMQTLTNADSCQELTEQLFPGREIKSIPILRDELAISEFIQRFVLVNKILTVEEYKIELITLIEKAGRPEPAPVPDDTSVITEINSDPTFKAQLSDFIESHFQVVELSTNENRENEHLTPADA